MECRWVFFADQTSATGFGFPSLVQHLRCYFHTVRTISGWTWNDVKISYCGFRIQFLFKWQTNWSLFSDSTLTLCFDKHSLYMSNGYIFVSGNRWLLRKYLIRKYIITCFQKVFNVTLVITNMYYCLVQRQCFKSALSSSWRHLWVSLAVRL